MSQETSNAILAIVAVLATFGSMIAFIVARFELQAQRKETKELARLTSELEHKVHRLATNLDHKIYRLERIRDLITGLMHTSLALRQQSRSHADKLEVALKREMTFPELNGLISVINDASLINLNTQLMNILVGDDTWPPLWNELPYDPGKIDELLKQQSSVTREMHKRVLELLEEATQSEGA